MTSDDVFNAALSTAFDVLTEAGVTLWTPSAHDITNYYTDPEDGPQEPACLSIHRGGGEVRVTFEWGHESAPYAHMALIFRDRRQTSTDTGWSILVRGGLYATHPGRAWHVLTKLGEVLGRGGEIPLDQEFAIQSPATLSKLLIIFAETYRGIMETTRTALAGKKP